MVTNVNLMNPTIKDIIDSMTIKEKEIMYEIVGAFMNNDKVRYTTLIKFDGLDTPKQTVILYLLKQIGR